MISKELYKGLSVQDKINILHYQRGASALCAIGQYECTTENPNKPMNPLYLYISNVLDLDFSVFYGSELAKKSWKYKDEMKKITCEFPNNPAYSSTYISDALGDILFIMLHTDLDYKINIELMETIDQKLRTLYQKYLTLVDSNEYRYEECGKLNGETIYKRVDR